MNVNAVHARPAHQQRDDEDTAVLLVVVAALAGSAGNAGDGMTAVAARSVWGDPAHRLGIGGPSATGWWRSGKPR